jgi:hypothetical protein
MTRRFGTQLVLDGLAVARHRLILGQHGAIANLGSQSELLEADLETHLLVEDICLQNMLDFGGAGVPGVENCVGRYSNETNGETNTNNKIINTTYGRTCES